jgi:hypothetical protein
VAPHRGCAAARQRRTARQRSLAWLCPPAPPLLAARRVSAQLRGAPAARRSSRGAAACHGVGAAAEPDPGLCVSPLLQSTWAPKRPSKSAATRRSSSPRRGARGERALRRRARATHAAHNHRRRVVPPRTMVA